MANAGRQSGVGVVPIPGTFERVACLADVHGNTAALEAVIGSAEFAGVDAVVFLGCTTTGPEPLGVLSLAARLDRPTFYLRGNGERAVLELADGAGDEEWDTGRWLVERHGSTGLAAIRAWPTGLIADLPVLGPTRFCHGSPRSDIELLTPQTSANRIREATSRIAERVVVHGHTHLQYERRVGNLRIIAPGSVGLPYTAGEFGARWAIIGVEVRLLTTGYDLAEAQHRIRATGYPNPAFLHTLEQPPTPAEIIADSETRLFSD